MKIFKKLLATLFLATVLPAFALGATQNSTNNVSAAGNLTGATLASGVTASSLTSTGTLVGGATGAGFTVAVGTSTITGVLPAANGGAGAVTGALKANGSGLVTQAACSDLSNATTACSTSISTSGANLGLLNGNNTYGGTANFTSTFSIGGTAETFPASGLLVGTTDTQTLTNKSIAGSEINSSVVGSAYGGAGAISGALKANGSGTVSQAACTDLSNGATGCSTATGTSGATLPLLNGANTWSGVQTITNSDWALLGSSTGKTTFTSDNSGASNFTLHVPAENDTLVDLAGTQSLTNKSIVGSEINSGTVSATYLPTATAAAKGVVQGDGSTLTITTGTISCTTGSSSQLGCLKPDGVTITSSGGSLTAVGGAATSIAVGTTTVVSGTNAYLLYNNSGVLGNENFVPTAHGGTGIDMSASTGVVQAASGTITVSTALPNGTTATTQTAASNDTKAATDAYVDTIGGYNAQTTTYAPTTTDKSKHVDFTGSSNTTFTIASCTTLGSNWWAIIANSGSSNAILTLKSSAGTLDGIAAATGFSMLPSEVRFVACDGTNFHTKVLQPFFINMTSTTTVTIPPGYGGVHGQLWGGGASGGAGATNGGGGGGGGGYNQFTLMNGTITVQSVALTCTVGAGGNSQTTANTAGNAGGLTTVVTGASIQLSQAYGGGAGGGSTLGAGGGGGSIGGGLTSGIGNAYSSLGVPAVSGVGGNAVTTTFGASGIGMSGLIQAAAGSGGNVSGSGFDIWAGSSGGNATNKAGGGGLYGGGGGGVSSTGTTGVGGNSIYGGGGGGGASGTTGSAGGGSVYGGAGGAGGSNGAGTGGAVGGGGGGGAVGTAGSGAGGGGRIILQGII